MMSDDEYTYSPLQRGYSHPVAPLISERIGPATGAESMPYITTDERMLDRLTAQADAGLALYWALYYAPADFWNALMKVAGRGFLAAYGQAQETFGKPGHPSDTEPVRSLHAGILVDPIPKLLP